MNIAAFKIGATFTIGIRLKTANITDSHAVTMSISKAINKNNIFEISKTYVADSVLNLTVANLTNSGNGYSGIVGTLTALQTVNLTEGAYYISARITEGANVYIAHKLVRFEP